MSRQLKVLLVEDSEPDAELIAEVFDEHKLMVDLHVVTDGEQAMSFLLKEGKFADSPRPDLVLLDLNLPRKDGREVLKQMKENPKFRAIPVVVLTTSTAEEDVLYSYQLYANCFVTKPTELEEFEKIVQLIDQFWLTAATLPPEDED